MIASPECNTHFFREFFFISLIPMASYRFFQLALFSSVFPSIFIFCLIYPQLFAAVIYTVQVEFPSMPTLK